MKTARIAVIITVWITSNSGVVDVVIVNVEVDEEDIVNVLEVDDTIEDVVETEFVCVWACRFNVIVPGPVSVTMVEMLEPEHVSPPEQLQLESV